MGAGSAGGGGQRHPDHPSALRFSDRINVVTVDSIQAFLQARQEGWRVQELSGPR